MRKKGFLYELKRAVHNADEICKIATGQPIAQVGARVMRAWGEDIKNSAKAPADIPPEPPPEDPYRVLHCHPDDYDMVIKGRFRLLVRDLHPDTGLHPDPAEFQRVNEAYKTIQEIRKKKAG